MKNILNNKIFFYFQQISKIPRKSGRENHIRDFLISFAQSKGLNFYSDKFNNVIIYKKNCNCEPIILQAHTDMVTIKASKSKVDFNKDGVSLVRKGNYICAKNTSLGADNGIGVAIILDILDSDLFCNIEAVFTSNEETTMEGAYNLDIKRLKSKKMICLDGFSEKTIVVSSASFTDFLVKFDNSKMFLEKCSDLKTYYLSVGGLKGGHSGLDIDKNIVSSHKLLTKLLKELKDINLIKFWGGLNFNIICAKSECIFSTSLPEKKIKQIIKRFLKQNQKVFNGLKINFSRQINQTLALQNGKKLLDFVTQFKNGVICTDNDHNVVASQNISEIDSIKGILKIGIRSFDKKNEKLLIQNLKDLTKEYGFESQVIGTQPAFMTKEDSQLLKDLKNACITPIKEKKMHIAVESGIFQKRIRNLDIVIISPTIENAHSINERLEISSVINTSLWLKTFFKNFS